MTIYLKGTAYSESPAARFLEVTRKGDCIISTDVLTRMELDERHQIYASWSELEEGASESNEGMDEGESSDSVLSEEETPNMDSAGSSDDGEYEDINFTALTNLYEEYLHVRACFEARRDLNPVYIRDSEMQKAESTLKSAEAEILRRNGRLDRDTAWRVAKSKSELITSVFIVSSRFEMNREMKASCRLTFAGFPPDVDKTARRKKDQIENKVNTGGGLIIPNDPRFN